MHQRDIVTVADVEAVDAHFRRPTQDVNLGLVVKGARSHMQTFNDDKAYASHNEMAAMQENGGQPVSFYKDSSGSTVRVISFRGIRFCHVCGGSQDICHRTDAYKLFEKV